jgi:hypothetical protein
MQVTVETNHQTWEKLISLQNYVLFKNSGKQYFFMIAYSTDGQQNRHI